MSTDTLVEVTTIDLTVERRAIAPSSGKSANSCYFVSKVELEKFWQQFVLPQIKTIAVRVVTIKRKSKKKGGGGCD